MQRIFNAWQSYLDNCPVRFKVEPKLDLWRIQSVTHFIWETRPPGLIDKRINGQSALLLCGCGWGRDARRKY